MLDGLFTVGGDIALLTPTLVVFNLLLAFALTLVIAYIYKDTHTGVSYSQTFVMTLIISGVVISAVMMVIGSNIAVAFGAFGAFSLIRFRTAIKDTKDMGYIFLVLAVGMAIGTNNYIIAVATTLITLTIIYVLTRMNFGSIRKFSYILTFTFDTDRSSENIYKEVFDKYLKSSNVLNIKALAHGKVLQLTFSIRFINEKDLPEFSSSLEKLEGISDVNLITAKNDVEY